MFLFIDESGNAGVRFDAGSSRFFVVAAVIIQNEQMLNSCERILQRAKQSLKLSKNYELHFRENSHAVRMNILQQITPLDWQYVATIIDKQRLPLIARNKFALYQIAISAFLPIIQPLLIKTMITIDHTQAIDFQRQLFRSIKHQIRSLEPDSRPRITMQRSQNHLLLQLADYVAGILNRRAQGLHKSQDYYQLIKRHEQVIITFPK